MMKFTRNAKIMGIDMTPFNDAYNLWRNCANKLSNWMRTNLKNGNIKEIKKYGAGYIFSFEIDQKYWTKDRDQEKVSSDKCTSAELKNYLTNETDIFTGCVIKGTGSQRRDVVNYVAERYKGYGVRNDKRKIPNIHIKQNKSWYFKEQFVTIDASAKTITIKTLLGNISSTYRYGLKDEKVSGKCGGNIKISRKEFICAVECEVEPMYEPVDILAYDMNMQENYWLTFSDNTVTPLPLELKQAIDQVHNTQDILREKEKPVNERKMRSKERSKLRYIWKAQHKHVKRLCKLEADIILQKVIDNKMILAIDGVSTGQSHGTWGQDHIPKYLITQCENRGIPFYVVNPAYTSQTCSICRHAEKKNRKETDAFNCQQCDYNVIAHVNAAANIKNKAQQYFNDSFSYGDYSTFKKEKLISVKLSL